MNDRYATYLTWVTLTAFMMVVLLLVLLGCSGEMTRMGGKTDLAPVPMNRDEERNHIVNQGAEFCQRYPDDIACKGPKAK